MDQYKIWHRKSTPYRSQETGQVESTNKVIESILTKTINIHRKDWANKLSEALWAYWTNWRNIKGHTPYELVYGKQVLLPIEFQIKTFRTAVQLGLDIVEWVRWIWKGWCSKKHIGSIVTQKVAWQVHPKEEVPTKWLGAPLRFEI